MHEDGHRADDRRAVEIADVVTLDADRERLEVEHFPELFERQAVLPVEHYPALLLETLRTSAPPRVRDPVVVVLTPGVYFAINAPAGIIGTTAESAAQVIATWGFTLSPADLTTLANQVAIALDNASAYQQIEEWNMSLEFKVRERTAALLKHCLGGNA